MRPFHLAFPVHDLEQARLFYTELLGCEIGRHSDKWIDFNLYGHQIVAHLSPNDCSLTKKNEVAQIIKYLKKKNKLKKTVLYYCVSSYPTEDKELCLFEIKEFKKKYDKELLAIGFSGHHKGIAIDMAALTLGAQYFERHFTLDRTYKGTDHSASLEPDGLSRLNRDLQSVSLTLKNWNGSFSKTEKNQRNKLKKIKK